MAELDATVGTGRWVATREFAPVGSASLVSLIAEHLGDHALVIGWSATAMHIATMRNGALVAADGSQMSAADWYGMRAFDGDVDMRWVAEGVGGRAVVVTETNGGEPDTAVIEGVRYLVFGERDDAGDGWVTLSAASVGALRVPSTVGGRRLAIRAVEYVRFDRDGNADVVEERLVNVIDAEVQ